MSKTVEPKPEDDFDRSAGTISDEQQRINASEAKKRFEKLQTSMRHGVLVAVPKEYSAIEAIFGKPKKWPNPSHPDNPVQYVEFTCETGSRAILIAGVSEAGIAQAASRASLIKWTNRHVNKIILVGIAAGQPHLEDPEADVRLGDIVVSQKVVQHDHIKITNGKVEPRGKNLQMPDQDLLQAANRLKARFKLTGERAEDFSWSRYIREGAKVLLNSDRPATDQNDGKRSYAHDESTGRRDGEPYVHIGTIASGSTLLKDEKVRNKLAKEFEAIAFEMEGAGLAIASATNDFKYLIVRGICDYADKDKNDDWQPYAALAATSFTRSLLEEI